MTDRNKMANQKKKMADKKKDGWQKQDGWRKADGTIADMIGHDCKTFPNMVVIQYLRKLMERDVVLSPTISISATELVPIRQEIRFVFCLVVLGYFSFFSHCLRSWCLNREKQGSVTHDLSTNTRPVTYSLIPDIVLEFQTTKIDHDFQLVILVYTVIKLLKFTWEKSSS